MEQLYHLEPYKNGLDNNSQPATYFSQDGQNQRTVPTMFRIPRKAVGHFDAGSDYTALIGHAPLFGHDPTQKNTSRSRILVLRWWIPELLASAISVGSLVGIAFFLRAYDGQSINTIQLPYSLSINGVLAFLATINRVALMVPIGSGMSQEIWLWFSADRNGKFRARRLKDIGRSDDASRSAWGSLKLILFYPGRWLACMGAFVTIVSLAFRTFTQQLVATTQAPATDNDSSVPGTIPRAETWEYVSGRPSEGDLTLPLDMRASLYNGILSSNVEPIVANCPTGNCTWPITPSLAVCGQCSATTFVQSCDSGAYCNYTTAAGKVISLMGIGESEGIGFVAVSTLESINSSSSDKFYIARFDMLGVPYGTFEGGYGEVPIQASTCALWFCVNAYNVNIKNLNQSQTITQSVHEYELVADSSLIQFSSLPPKMNPAPNIAYSVDYESSAAFVDTLETLLGGSATLNQEATVSSSGTLEAIWASSANPDPWIRQVALSITNNIRQGFGASGIQDDLYNGTAYETVITIRWYWIILPGVMVLLSLLFLALVLIQTAKSDIASWKGGPLTYLLFDLDAGIRKLAVGSTDVHGGMEDAVRHRRVLLGGQTGGLRSFRGAQGS